MLLEAGVTSNPGRPDAVAGRRAAGPPGRRAAGPPGRRAAGACSRLTVPQGVRRAPRPDHESRDCLQDSGYVP